MSPSASPALRNKLVDSPAVRQVVKQLFAVRGGRAVAHAIRSNLYVDRTVVIDDFDDDLQFECHLDEHMGTQIFWRGMYSASQLAVVDRLLTSDDMTFLDIGANQGEFSVFAAKRLPRGRVIAFEPDPDLAARLQRNLDRNNFDQVDVRQHALWHEDTTLTLHLPDDTCYDGSHNEGLGSLYAGPNTHATVEVDCLRLDDVVAELGLDRIDVIKIDVEGAEPNVLRGAEETLARFQPTLLVEADRDRSEAADQDVNDLIDQLLEGHDLEVITKSGGTHPLETDKLGAHENLICTPKRRLHAAA